jgi:hypothetical protein
MQAISDSAKDKNLGLHEAYNSLTLKKTSPPSIEAAPEGDAQPKDAVAMKLQEFISKDNKTIQAPKTLDEQLKTQLFEAIDQSDSSSKFEKFAKEKDKTRLVTTTETTNVKGIDVLVTTAKPKDADAPAADGGAVDATYTFESPQATTTFRTLGTVIEVNGIANIDEDGAIKPESDDGKTITATITQQGKDSIKCEDAEVSLANASAVSVTGGTVTQKISDTTITVELTPDWNLDFLFALDPRLTIVDGKINQTSESDSITGKMTIETRSEKITFNEPVSYTINTSGELEIRGVGFEDQFKYSVGGGEFKDATLITIELNGTIKANGNTIGEGGAQEARPMYFLDLFETGAFYYLILVEHVFDWVHFDRSFHVPFLDVVRSC